MLIDLVVLGALVLVPLVAAGGLRRWPWRYATLAALGWMVVLGAARLTIEDVDPYLLVSLGAIGGAAATLGYERGERERVRRTESILAGRPQSLNAPAAGDDRGVRAPDGAHDAM